MTNFKPRLTAPSSTDKNWTHYTKGGYNYCILINGTSVLPNCVGYAWGRWREILGEYHKLSRRNAENWYDTKDGYERGQTPRVGSIICWRQGSTATHADGAGHVGVVEEVFQNGSIIISNSDYKGSKFYTRKFDYPYRIGGGFSLQGFIHLPIEFTNTKQLPLTDVAKLVLEGKYGNGKIRINKLRGEGYDPVLIQREVNRLLHQPYTPPKPKLKPLSVVAKEVRDGIWGNGAARVTRLTKEGYDPVKVQAEVNRQLRNR